MGTEPTFTPDALTERQLDGLACVVCGDTFAAGSRSVPVGEALGAQVFACSSHVADATDDGQGDAELRERAARRATWPDGEPASVRDMEQRREIARRADDLAAELERDFADVRDEGITADVRATIDAMRALSAAAGEADEEMIWRTAVHAHAALTRCALLVAEVERRTR